MEGIAVVGAGPLARRTARVVTRVVVDAAAGGPAPLPRAVIIAGRLPHPVALIRRALDRGAGVLVLEPRDLDAATVRRLAALGRRRGSCFHVVRPLLQARSVQLLRERLHREPYEACQAMLSATVTVDPEAASDEANAAAEEALLLMVQLIGTMPSTVTALRSHTEFMEESPPVVASALFPGGALGRIGVSATCAQAAFRIEIVMPDTVMRVDLARPQEPLRVEEVTPEGLRVEMLPAVVDGEDGDEQLRELVQSFWESLSADVAPSVEVGLEPLAARLREALFESLEHQGQPYHLDGEPAPGPPDLRLIRGGGRSTTASRPALRLVEVT